MKREEPSGSAGRLSEYPRGGLQPYGAAPPSALARMTRHPCAWRDTGNQSLVIVMSGWRRIRSVLLLPIREATGLP